MSPLDQAMPSNAVVRFAVLAGTTAPRLLPTVRSGVSANFEKVSA